MQLSPKESRQSMLSEEFLTLIQRSKEEWLGSLPPTETGSSQHIFHSGISSLTTFLDAYVDLPDIIELVWQSLGQGDGSVDVPATVARIVKEVIVDVIVEFGEVREDR